MKGKRSMTEDQRVIFLRLICENKEKLFGKFSATLTDAEKQQIWNDIINTCVDRYGFHPSPGKSWHEVRDQVWSQAKSRALKKRDEQRQTGGEGGTDKKFSQADLIIYETIGVGTPTLDGL